MSICTPSIRRALRATVHTALATSALVLASCQSSRPAYLFKPSASAAMATVVPSHPSTTAQSAVLVTAPSVREVPVVRLGQVERQPEMPSAVSRQQRRMALPRPLVAWQRTARPAAQAVKKMAKPRHTKEVGLGTTVLGVLGLIVLPISLLGLLIWGGPVWAILAGLAAIAVLVAYLDPFG